MSGDSCACIFSDSFFVLPLKLKVIVNLHLFASEGDWRARGRREGNREGGGRERGPGGGFNFFVLVTLQMVSCNTANKQKHVKLFLNLSGPLL